MQPLHGHVQPLHGHVQPLNGHVQPLHGNVKPLNSRVQPLHKRTLTVGGRITVQFISSLTGLDLAKQKICCYLYALRLLNPNKSNCRSVSLTVILPPTVSVVCLQCHVERHQQQYSGFD